MRAVQTKLFSTVVHNCFSSVATEPIRLAKKMEKFGFILFQFQERPTN